MKKVREAFNPQWHSVFYNPFYIIRKGLYQAIKNKINYMQGTLLDFGCGSKPYMSLLTVDKYIGLDYETEVSKKNENLVADVFYDGKTIPFGDNYFDSVFSSEVLEHVFNPDDILKEISRVLKPGGHLLLTCPFFWPEHEQPYDYARYSSFAMRHLMDKNDLEIVSYEKTGSYFESLAQGFILYLYYFIPHKPRILERLFFIIFLTPFLLVFLAIAAILPRKIKRNDLYLNNVILAKKR